MRKQHPAPTHRRPAADRAGGVSPNTVSFANAAAGVKRGGGQNARATVARAFCQPPSVTDPCANLTVLGVSPPRATFYLSPCIGKMGSAHQRQTHHSPYRQGTTEHGAQGDLVAFEKVRQGHDDQWRGGYYRQYNAGGCRR